jgi:hypothetical protein
MTDEGGEREERGRETTLKNARRKVEGGGPRWDPLAGAAGPTGAVALGARELLFALDFAVGESLHATLPSPPSLNLLPFFSSSLQALFFPVSSFSSLFFPGWIARKIMRK